MWSSAAALIRSTIQKKSPHSAIRCPLSFATSCSSYYLCHRYASSSSAPRRRNLFGSNAYRRQRHLRRVAAQQQAESSPITINESQQYYGEEQGGYREREREHKGEITTSAPLAVPRVCLGCGCTFQTEYEHKPGFIEQQSIDRYTQHIEKINNKAIQEEQEKSNNISGVGSNKQRLEARDETEEDSNEATDDKESSLNSSGLSWQDSLRLGEINEDDVKKIYGIDIISPKQLKEELKAAKGRYTRRGRSTIDSTLLPLSPSSPISASSSSHHLLPKPLRCVRCYQLSHYGYTRGNISTIVAEDFRRLLKARFLQRGGTSCVILLLIDLWDIDGSMIEDFTSLVGGRNPIILVYNKRDLLPTDYGENRIRAWLKAEAIQRYHIHFHSIQLISAKSGEGIPGLMRKAAELAASNAKIGQRDIYIIGSANTGKSALINKLREMKYIRNTGHFIPTTQIQQQEHEETNTDTRTSDQQIKTAASDTIDNSTDNNTATSTVDAGYVTSSMFPGTTLGVVGFPLIPAREGMIYDTPGIINNRALSTELTFHELRAIIPHTKIVPITYRLSAGQSMLLGGLARIDMIDGRPFFFTAYVSSFITVHITNIETMDTDNGNGIQRFCRQHLGRLISPPFTADRWDQLGLFNAPRVRFQLNGKGWEEACDDIVFPGIGWIAITGVGPCSVRASMVTGSKHQQQPTAAESSSTASIASAVCLPFAREPLMPFDARTTTTKFHGSDRRIKRTNPLISDIRHSQPEKDTSHTSSFTTHISSLSSPIPAAQQQQTTRAFSTSARRRDTSTTITTPSVSSRFTPISESTSSSSSSSLSSSPSSSKNISPSSSVPFALPLSRPDWHIYRQQLVSHDMAIFDKYRRTREYLKRPKGSWRLHPAGHWLKLYRWKPSPKYKQGKFRKAIEARKKKKREQLMQQEEEEEEDEQIEDYDRQTL